MCLQPVAAATTATAGPNLSSWVTVVAHRCALGIVHTNYIFHTHESGRVLVEEVKGFVT